MIIVQEKKKKKKKKKKERERESQTPTHTYTHLHSRTDVYSTLSRTSHNMRNHPKMEAIADFATMLNNGTIGLVGPVFPDVYADWFCTLLAQIRVDELTLNDVIDNGRRLCGRRNT